MFVEMLTFYKHLAPNGVKTSIFYPFSINITSLRDKEMGAASARLL